jgi:hypothetical protein
MIFIPPGPFKMGSPTNEVDRLEDDLDDVLISLKYASGLLASIHVNRFAAYGQVSFEGENSIQTFLAGFVHHSQADTPDLTDQFVIAIADKLSTLRSTTGSRSCIALARGSITLV